MPQMMPLGWAWMILSLVLVYFVFMVIFYFLVEVEVMFSLGEYGGDSKSWE
uniref:ATP synthase F0 subunit 8 n=1 Tax=Olivierus martensii TaxID=34649 RepID=A7RAB4_OLIMR|nr:ATP synthase F0 subunit 8 [Mesobuthus martensii]ABC71909.1 ATP synthase F0 subunit 8 [Mesobuthus martensii]